MSGATESFDFASAPALLTLGCVTLAAPKKPLAIDFCVFLFRLTIQLVLKQKKDANEGARHTLLGAALHLPTLPLVSCQIFSAACLEPG